MSEAQTGLPESVSVLQVDGKQVYLVGTAHVSKQSVEDVRKTVEEARPDVVCVELCQARYQSIIQRDSWEKMNIFKVLRERKGVFLFAQLIMTGFYRRLGKKFGVEPGAEMIEGVEAAKRVNAELVLADRNIEVTLKRVWGHLGFWRKMGLLSQLLLSCLGGEKIDEETIEEMKKQDQLEVLMAEFSQKYPDIKRRLIDERDVYLAEKIRTAPGNTIVAVVGAGHKPGIEQHIHQPQDLEEITRIPPPSIWPKIIQWGIPVLICALVAYSFFKGGREQGIENIFIWFLVNGIFSAIGTAAALAHPLAILAAFLAAPFTSLNPMIAAGFAAGIVQALVHKPTVADFKALPDDLETVKGFWRNSVIKVFMVLVLANVGSMIGTWVAGFWIAGRTF